MSWSLPSSRFRPFLVNLKGGLFHLSNVALAFLTKPLSILLGLVFRGHANATPMEPPTTGAVAADHFVLLVLLRFQFPADVARIRMKTFVRNSLSGQLLLWLLRACLLFASLYSLSDLFFPG